MTGRRGGAGDSGRGGGARCSGRGRGAGGSEGGGVGISVFEGCSVEDGRGRARESGRGRGVGAVFRVLGLGADLTEKGFGGGLLDLGEKRFGGGLLAFGEKGFGGGVLDVGEKGLEGRALPLGDKGLGTGLAFARLGTVGGLGLGPLEAGGLVSRGGLGLGPLTVGLAGLAIWGVCFPIVVRIRFLAVSLSSFFLMRTSRRCLGERRN